MMTNILRALMLSLSCLAYGQNVTVGGSVTDDSNQPLPGVNIIVKNTSKGTTTDFDGNYTLSDVPVNATLVFSYVGFVVQEVVVKNSNPINVSLVEDAQALTEVVVIGYGTQKKELVSGAFSSLKAEEITKRNPMRIEEALKGNVSGVQVNATSGSPGAPLNIRIRGITTNGNNSPLVVVDGVNIGSDLSIIDPNDIESMNVIKDASTAIYGVQGGNGVILVTTKSGRKSMKTKFEYSTYYTIQEAENTIDMMDRYEYAAYVNETEAADGNPIPYPNFQLLDIDTDWQDKLFKRAPMFSHSLTASGGTEKVTYSFGASYFGQDGIIASDKSNFQRWTVKNNLGIELTEKLKVNTMLLYTNIRSQGIPEGNRGSVLYYALNASPLSPIYDGTDGSGISRGFAYIGSEQGTEIINPMALIHNTFNEGFADRFTGKIEFEYDILMDLKATTRLNFNYSDYGGRSFSPLQYYGPGKVVNNVSLDPTDPTAFNLDRNNDGIRDVYGTVSENTQNSFLYTWETFLNYNKSFGNHNFNVVLGTSLQSDKYKGFFGSGPLNRAPESWDYAYLFNSQSIVQVVDGEVTQSLVSSSSSINEDRLYSIFGRLQYDYNNKYLFSAILRRDASTRFGPNFRVAYFPSFSAGWLVSNEGFFNSGFIDQLKLRGSWGTTGSDKFGSYRWLGAVNGEAVYPFGDMLITGSAVGGLANPDLKWEELKQTNIGTDITLFDHKLGVSVDYYRKKTVNLLLVPEVSALLGASAPGSSAPFVNAGTIENKGIDFSLNFSHRFSDNFGFNAGYNLTTVKNKALSVNNAAGFLPGGLFGLGQSTSRFQTGLPIGVFYGLQADGVFQNQSEIDAHAVQPGAQPGDLRYVDVDGDGVIEFGSSDDLTVIGNPIPDVTMGFSLGIDFCNFDFATSLYASIGNDVVRSYERFLTYSNKSTLYLDRWRGEGTSNEVPRASSRATNNQLFSSFYVEDGSYLRIQNVQLGYSIPEKFLGKMGLDRFRVYVAVNNLYTFTKYKGYNPDVSNSSPLSAGVDLGQYPNTRTFTTGINVSF